MGGCCSFYKRCYPVGMNTILKPKICNWMILMGPERILPIMLPMVAHMAERGTVWGPMPIHEWAAAPDGTMYGEGRCASRLSVPACTCVGCKCTCLPWRVRPGWRRHRWRATSSRCPCGRPGKNLQKLTGLKSQTAHRIIALLKEEKILSTIVKPSGRTPEVLVFD